jgi:Fe-S-cluster containining protein
MKLFERAGRNVVFNPQGLEPQRLLPFTCLGSECPNTCCGPFHGTRAVDAMVKQEDLGKIIGKDPDTDPDLVSIFAQIRLTETDIERLRNAGNDWLMIRRGDTSTPHYYMRLQEDGSCAALGADGMCSVHASRPTICRAFPFYIDLFAGLSMVNSCPGVGAGEQTVERLMPEITAAADMYEFWIQEIRPQVL